MATVLTNNHYPSGSVCQVVYGWAQQNNSTISAGNSSDITYYTLSFTPKFPNSFCIYETTITGQTSSDGGYVRFSLKDNVTGDTLHSNANASYIAASGYTHTEWIDIPIRSHFIPQHTNAMTINLRATAITGDFASNWSSGDYRLMTVTEIAQ